MALKFVKNKTLTRAIKSCFESVRSTNDSTTEEFYPPLKEGDPPLKPFEQIPGPTSYSLEGLTFDYKPSAAFDYENMPQTFGSLYEKYGDLVKEGDVGNCVVHAFNPEDIKRVYHVEGTYPRRKSHTALGTYRKERPTIYSGEGLLPTNGEVWKQFRLKFNDAYVSKEATRDVIGDIEELSDELIANVPAHLNEKNEVDILPLLQRWGLEMTTRATFGKNLGCFTAEGYPLGDKMIKAAEVTHRMIYDIEINNGNYESNFQKLVEAQDILAGAIDSYFEEFLLSDWKNEKCLAAKLLKCEGASRTEVFTLLVDTYLAGIDSAAFSLIFTLYRLATSKSAQDRLREEIKELLPEINSRMPNLETAKLPYLDSVFKEALRLHPVAVGNCRITAYNLNLSGYFVPANTTVIMQNEVIFKNDIYYPNALEFRPERWTVPKRKAHAYSPFGFGRRFCIGMRLAETSIKTAILKFVNKYEFSYHHEPVGSKTLLLNFPVGPVKIRIDKINQ